MSLLRVLWLEALEVCIVGKFNTFLLNELVWDWIEWRKRWGMLRLSFGFLAWEIELMAGVAANRASEF